MSCEDDVGDDEKKVVSDRGVHFYSLEGQRILEHCTHNDHSHVHTITIYNVSTNSRFILISLIFYLVCISVSLYFPFQLLQSYTPSPL